uniref:Uncharacterized protein n=1 Tax=Ciona savignyi TaxID=51511 RepID=H2YHL5_CIOSA
MPSSFYPSRNCKIIQFQPATATDTAYCLSFALNKSFCKGECDIIFRITGSRNDGPLFHFRDFNNNLFRTSCTINIGFYIPINIGKIENVGICVVENFDEEPQNLMIVSNVAIRKLQKLEANDPRLMDFLPSNVQTWINKDTYTGSTVIGASHTKNEPNGLLQARKLKLFQLDEQTPQMQYETSSKYMAQHYIFSMFKRWHNMWSEFSHLDH